MFELQLIFLVVVLIYSLFSVIGYSKRRSRDKAALRGIQQGAQPIRSLTPQERERLKPHLVDPHRANKPVELTSESVYRIGGAYERHGIVVSGSGGSETMHDTIGGVEVIFPYDALAFLESYNNAEVVLTPKFAVIVKLNDAFDLEAGHRRAEAARQRQERWEAGATGKLTPATPVADAADAIDPVQILAQREETEAEAATRRRPGLGWLGAISLLVAFGLLLAGGYREDIWLWLLSGVAVFALGQWLLWRRRQIRRQKVNQVRAELLALDWNGTGARSPASTVFYLGADVAVELPKHWLRWLPSTAGRSMDLDVGVDDAKVVRIGDTLSLDAEARLFPLVSWGKHALLAVVGAAMVLIAWGSNGQIGLDWAHVWASLGGQEPVVLAQAANVMDRPPAEGTLVRVQAQVRCQIPDPRYEALLGPVDCQYVRWGGTAPQVAEMEPEPGLRELRSGELVRAERDSMLEMMIRLQAIRSGDSDAYASEPEVRRLDGFSALVLAADQACARGGSGTQSVCKRLQAVLSEEVVLLGDTEVADGWEARVEHARSGLMQQEGDRALVATRTVSMLRSLLAELADEHIRTRYEPSQQEAWASQRGGIVLPLTPVGLDRFRQGAPREYADPVLEQPERSEAPWTRWASYRTLASEQGLWPLELTGMVVHYDASGDGEALLEIDTDRVPETVGPAALRLLALLAGVALLLAHGALWLLNRQRLRKREQAIEAHYAAKFGQAVRTR